MNHRVELGISPNLRNQYTDNVRKTEKYKDSKKATSTKKTDASVPPNTKGLKMIKDAARNCEAGCVCDDPPCPFGCEITWCKECQRQHGYSYPQDCMCPEEYGIMAKSCKDLSNYLMVSKSNGYITIEERVVVENNSEYQQYHQDAELIKMQSEVYLSEQIKKEIRNEDIGHAPGAKGSISMGPTNRKTSVAHEHTGK